MTDYLLEHNANTHWDYPTSAETDDTIARARQAARRLPELLAARDRLRREHDHPDLPPRPRARPDAGGRATRSSSRISITTPTSLRGGPWSVERGIVVRAARLIPETAARPRDDLAQLVSPNDPSRSQSAAARTPWGPSTTSTAWPSTRPRRQALFFVDAVHLAPHGSSMSGPSAATSWPAPPTSSTGRTSGCCMATRDLLRDLDVPEAPPAPDNAPDALETGTQNHEGIVGAAAAVDFLASLDLYGGQPPRAARPRLRRPARAGDEARADDLGGPFAPSPASGCTVRRLRSRARRRSPLP